MKYLPSIFTSIIFATSSICSEMPTQKTCECFCSMEEDYIPLSPTWMHAYNGDWSNLHRALLLMYHQDFESALMDRFLLVYYFYRHADFEEVAGMLDCIDRMIEDWLEIQEDME